MTSVLLCSVFLLSAGCDWKVKPTYSSNALPQALVKICKDEYKMNIQARQVGDNLQSFFWRVGLLQGTKTTEMKPEAANALEHVLLSATRISLSTDAKLSFVEVKMADVLTGATVTLWRYVPDIRDSMYTRMAEDEYLNRLVVEVDPTGAKDSIATGAPLWDPPMNMPEFLAKQVVLRFKRQSPVSLEAHEDLSSPRTLTVVVDNWPAIERENPGQKEEVAKQLEKTSRAVVQGYRFSGFQNVILRNAHGDSLRSWKL